MVKKTKKTRNTPAEKVHAIDCDMGVDCTCMAGLCKCARSLTYLEDHFRLCRRYGVLEWEGPVPGATGAVKFKLASALASDPDPVAPSTPQVGAAQPEDPVKGPKKRGADGLDATMQEELLGRVMDAER